MARVLFSLVLALALFGAGASGHAEAASTRLWRETCGATPFDVQALDVTTKRLGWRSVPASEVAGLQLQSMVEVADLERVWIDNAKRMLISARGHSRVPNRPDIDLDVCVLLDPNGFQVSQIARGFTTISKPGGELGFWNYRARPNDPEPILFGSFTFKGFSEHKRPQRATLIRSPQLYRLVFGQH